MLAYIIKMTKPPMNQHFCFSIGDSALPFGKRLKNSILVNP